MALGWLARMALDDAIGSETGIGDRLGGAVLGAVRVGLVAITLVLIFDQLVPADRQPAFLTGSQLRPWLSMAGQKGFQSLPPEVTAYIDRLKHDRRIERAPRHADRDAFGAATAPYSGPPDFATVAPSDFQKSSDVTGVKQWILESKAAAPSYAPRARVWDAPARSRWPPRACMSR